MLQTLFIYFWKMSNEEGELLVFNLKKNFHVKFFYYTN